MIAEEKNWVALLTSTDDVRDQALGELSDFLVRGIAATIKSRHGNKIQPEDVVQEALLKILDKLDTFQGRSKFTTWAMTIAVRIAVSEMRRKHFKDVSMNSLLADNMQFEPAALDHDIANDNEDKVAILGKLRQLIDTVLSEKQRNAIHALLGGMPVEVFAEKTGSNRNAVYKLVHDARTKLRHGFEQAGVASEDFNSIF